MVGDATEQRTPTRRECVKYGGAIIGGGLLAGCTEQSDTETPNETESQTSTATEPYSVTMSPVGDVVFDEVPQSVCGGDPQWADNLVALGQQEKINSLTSPDLFFTGYYDQLPGVSFDPSQVTALWQDGGIDKETIYELDSDVHHMDPVDLVYWDTMTEDDVEEIKSNVGPFFGNAFSLFNRYEGDKPYQYYTLWELSEKFEQVYRMEDEGRIGELKQVRDEMAAEIRSKLPPKDEQPTVGLVWFSKQEETFVPYKMSRPGFGQAEYRPLEATDVFAELDQTGGSNQPLDYEGMLEFDPDVLIQKWGVTRPEPMEELVYEPLRNHPVGSQLAAVKNDRVHPGGTTYQGPIFNIFQMEIAAKGMYPGIFGEFRGVGKTPEGERLFDRQRVADIVNGDL
ncbi:ABC transporter substrate-binding protein (plasmid) [Haloferacaceae archaeon DSL9]